MPGILGIIPEQVIGNEEHRLNQMMKPMIHEPFYNCGKYLSTKPLAFVGYVTIDKSFSDCMPIKNETDEIFLFLSGECFNDPQIKTALLRSGHRFLPHDASYLIHLYEEHGRKFFSRLNGWFSGLIIDQRINKVYLFNDRYGIRKIYYHENNEGLFFSSEAKSLLSIFPKLRYIDPRGLGEYLEYDCVMSNRTLFSGISLMAPGSVWSFECTRKQKEFHTDHVQLENQSKLPESIFFNKLGECFLDILPWYLAGGPKCLALTGGLDTRMIIACSAAAPGDLPCLTHGGMYNEMLDVRIARKVAAACGQKHNVICLDKSYLNDFHNLSERAIYISDGLANAFESHHLFLNNAIQKIAPIKITGKYGSQVIKNISAFHRPSGYASNEKLFSQDLSVHLAAARSTFAEHTNGHPLSLMLFKEVPWWWGGIISLEFSQLAVRSPYLDNQFTDLLFRSPYDKIDPVVLQLGIIKRRQPELAKIMTNAGYIGDEIPIISRAQRNLYRFINIVEKIYGRDKLPSSLHHPVAWIDHHFLSPLRFNMLFLGLGDYRHYRLWARDEFASYIRSVILDSHAAARPYWNKSFLEKAVRDHTTGQRNRLTEIQKVLSIELIHRTLLGSA